MKKQNRSLHAAALLAALSTLPAVHAATYYWNNPTTGLWATGANWSNNATSEGTTGTVPNVGGGDSVVFNQSAITGNETVQFGADASVAGITFANTGTTLLQSSDTTPRTLILSSVTVNSGAGAATIGNATNILNVSFNQSTTTFTLNGGNALNFVNTVTQTGSAVSLALAVNGAGNTLTLNNYNLGRSDLAGKTVTLSGTGNVHITGTVADNSTSASSLIYTGTGKLTLSGTSTYTGATTIGTTGGAASTVQFAKQVSLYNNGSARAWTASAFRVNTGATMAFNVGGTGEFTTANIGTLSALTGATSGFTPGAILGLDTTNASGGVFTLSNAIGLNRASQGLIKLGTGTLDLASANGNTISATTAGTTTVAAGKLRISNTSGSATGITNVLVNGGATTSLEGLGISTGALTVTGSRIAPGLNTTGANTNFGSAGTIRVGTVGGATFTNAHFDFDLSNLASGTNDRIATGGALSMGTIANFLFNELDGSLQTGVAYTIISGANSANTSVDTSGWTTSFLNGLSYDAIYSFNGNDLQVTFSAVPEPSTFAALAGLAGLGFAASRRRRRA